MALQVNRLIRYPLVIRGSDGGCAGARARGHYAQCTYLMSWHGSLGEAMARAPEEGSPRAIERTLGTILDQLDLVDRTDPREASGWFKRYFPTTPAARAAADMIVYDQAARGLHRPLSQYLNLPAPRRTRSSCDLYLRGPARLEHDLDRLKSFGTITVRCGEDLGPVREGLQALGRLWPGRVQIDAGGRWTLHMLGQLLPTLSKLHIECLIQPLPRGRMDEIAVLREGLDWPILYDMSQGFVRHPEILARYYDGFRTDLMTCGGITEALRLIERARELGLRAGLTCPGATSAALTATAHLAGAVDFVNLGPLLTLQNDPVDGVHLEDDRLVMPDRSGLGAVVRSEYLDYFERS